jgi:hypothetical protein
MIILLYTAIKTSHLRKCILLSQWLTKLLLLLKERTHSNPSTDVSYSAHIVLCTGMFMRTYLTWISGVLPSCTVSVVASASSNSACATDHNDYRHLLATQSTSWLSQSLASDCRGLGSILGQSIWVCGGQSGTGAGSSLSTSVSPANYHSTSAPFFHLSSRAGTMGQLVA